MNNFKCVLNNFKYVSKGNVWKIVALSIVKNWFMTSHMTKYALPKLVK